jgi:integrase
MKGISCHLRKNKRSPYWQMRYRLPNETKWRQESLGVREKQNAERLKIQFIIKLEKELVGIAPSELEITNAHLSLFELVEEYRDDLHALKRGDEYVKTTCQQVTTIAKDCCWMRVSDIKADGFTRWRSRNGQRSPRTLNLYLASLKAFLNWLIRTGRLESNLLDLVANVKTTNDIRRERRAFTDTEIRRLLTIAPPERRIVYLTAIHTGLRRGELFALEWRDMFVDEVPALMILRAETTKNDKREPVYLHPELVAELKAIRSDDVTPGQKVFVKISRMAKFKQDLKAANIPYRDEFDRVADFHALRHTCNSRMAANGVPSTIAQQMMRHSDIKLTMGAYLDTKILPIAAHVNALPSLMPSGVSSIVSHSLVSEGHELSRSDTETKQGDTKKPLVNKGLCHGLTHSDTSNDEGKNGSCAWDRTKDLVINSQAS